MLFQNPTWWKHKIILKINSFQGSKNLFAKYHLILGMTLTKKSKYILKWVFLKLLVYYVSLLDVNMKHALNQKSGINFNTSWGKNLHHQIKKKTFYGDPIWGKYFLRRNRFRNLHPKAKLILSNLVGQIVLGYFKRIPFLTRKEHILIIIH